MDKAQSISDRLGRHALSPLALALWLVACPLAAQPLDGASDGAGAGDDATARALYKSGRVAFEAGRYADALASWNVAYGLTARVALQYNIARAHDALGQHPEAIAAYESYVKWQGRQSDPGRVPEVRERLAELQKPKPVDDGPVLPLPAPGQQTSEPPQGAAQAPQSQQAPAPAPVVEESAPPPAEPRTNLWPVVLLAGGGALVLGGGIAGLAALGAESDLDDLCGTDRKCAPEHDRKRRDLASDIDAYGLTADVLIILGLASVGIGVWLALSDDEPAAMVACGLDGCGGSVRWGF